MVSHSTFHIMQQSQWIHEDGMCGLTVNPWGSPACVTATNFIVKLEAETIGCTVFMDWWWSHLDLQWSPTHLWSLETEPSLYTVRSCGLLFSWIRILISESVWSAGHSWYFSGRSVREIPCQFGYLSHSLVCLSSASWTAKTFMCTLWHSD